MNDTVQPVPIDRLKTFAATVLCHFDVPEADAEQAADVLVTADARGIDSHGIARLRTYVDLLDRGTINPRPSIRVLTETATTATVDGDNGLGLVVGPWANRLAMEKAGAMGTGWVAVRRSNHFGIAGYYPLQALSRDMIGWAMTNSGNLVAPLRGAARMLGTNPIAVAFPGLTQPPIVIDLATSAVSYGKIQLAHRAGQPIPVGWAIDADGRPTEDPERMMNGGALLPLGSDEHGSGHKGYALAAVVDLLCGVLSGAGWGPFAPHFALRQGQAMQHADRGTGHFFGAWRIDGFIDPDEFKRQIDDWIHTFRATKPLPGTDGPLIPGDPEREAEAQRRTGGVPLPASVVQDLRTVSARTDVPFD